MPEPRIVVVSPPFASHAQPLATVAAALAAEGADVTFACDPAFADLAARRRLRFEPLGFGDNANTGIAERTRQQAAGARRLTEFLDATRAGAVPALLAQARHRRADMLPDPAGVHAAVRRLDDRLRPDWYLVDQLAYAVTLALCALNRRWAAFCPGHPGYVLDGPGRFFGLPPYWPDAITPPAAELAALRTEAEANDRLFTELFTGFLAGHAPGRPAPRSAFGLTSSEAVLFNYPELPWLPPLPAGPELLFAGHCSDVGEAELPPGWRDRVGQLTDGGRRRLVLVSFGTFLSARDDVLATVVRGAARLPDVSVLVSAGNRAGTLRTAFADRRWIEVLDHVPQRALLPSASLVVHHGGNNTFTECLAAGVPAIALPFSSDQFAVAHDLERIPAGRVLDPHRLTPAVVTEATASVLSSGGRVREAVAPLLASGGPKTAARRLLEAMDHPPNIVS
ncbi:nucleotide disphospho-sugar-binding domain-containing protein [Amycolatopsis sp. CA-126428]|uniref:nucleotide disphospho-sugar-binding domain-containing protein n=1 Tax=Amycolatopsis sp. CA-126428 TaxID=2073158 RepID=UPI000CD096B3|nr:glycosyltransferase [Amycolatopsis sp. CA-126428]